MGPQFYILNVERLVGKQRPRTRIVKGKGKIYGQTYTPAATKNFEADITDKIKKIMEKERYKTFPAKVPLDVKVLFFFHIPASLSKKKKAQTCGQFVTKRPDIDNLLKSVLDAMNGIVYADDAQICHLSALKVYHQNKMMKDEIQIEIWERDNEL